MPVKAHNQETRARLLAAAAEVFAEKGFEVASVREICAKAGANVAAVNYHFGDKRNLYNTLLNQLFADTWNKRAPLLPASAPPEARLRAFIQAFFDEVLSSDYDERGRAQAARLYLLEMARPSEALTLIVRDYIRRDAEEIAAIVGALLGPSASEAQVTLCASSVVAQVLYYLQSAAIIACLAPDAPPPHRRVAQLAEHVYQFSLGGLTRLAAAPPPAKGETPC